MASQTPAPDAPSTKYSRDTTIKAITSFYKFLTSDIPGLHPEDLKSPPPPESNQWPDLSPLDKTADVLDLLHHLPIFSPSTGNRQIAPETSPINYSSPDVSWALSKGQKLIQGNLSPFGAGQIPPHVAVLTEGRRYGSWLLLDTQRGTITDFIQFEKPERDSPGPEDPDYWRAYRTLPIDEFFEEWKEKFRGLEWVVLPDDGDDSVRYRFDGETDEIRQIYREHGWPDEFRKEECGVALKEWYEKNKG